MNVQELTQLIPKPIQPGCMLCVANGVPGLTGWFIRRTQLRLLRDISLPEDFAVFTHTAFIRDSEGITEQYPPKARWRNWHDALQPGTRILIRRPKGVSNEVLTAIARHGDNLVTHGALYPTKELLTYYLWSWRFNKIALGRHFIDVFKQRTNVCSGSYWEALVEHANLPTKEPPEAWYPARLAADTTYFDTILDITVSSATSSGSKESDHAT